MKNLVVDRSAIIVGAGPAGASAALGFARNGYQVSLFEQRSICQERVCGAYLNPEAVGHLRWLGVLDAALDSGAVPVEKAQVTLPSGEIAELMIGQPGRRGLALPRPTMEAILLTKARGAGVEVLHGTHVKEIDGQTGTWTARGTQEGRAVERTANILTRAGGRFSGDQTKNHGSGWYGWNAPFDGIDQEPGGLSLHFFQGGYVGVLTFGNGQSNVCGLVRRTTAQTKSWEAVFQEALECQPSLRRLAAGGRRVGEWRGVGPLPFALGMRPHGHTILAGDAAAVGDPFLGEGIGRALAAGRMIDQALRAGGDLGLVRRYSSLWRRRYSLRLWFGFFARELLTHPSAFEKSFRMLLNRRAFLERLLDFFQTGVKTAPEPTPS